ncbi:MAG: aldo/keto reductase [Puniceicoccaceae bacterium]|nr:MAG: aldo/keto reductase [Puniceicoccaceae bacterium]
MHYRTLGSTGLEVSVVGFGTWQFGGEWGMEFDQPTVDAMFDEARACGINLIDTAECYGDHTSERLIGGAIARDREKWIVATKFGHKFFEPFKREERITPTQVVEQLEDSLRALRTDYVDLLQFHSLGDEQFRTEGLWETLAQEKAKGKVRHLGISIGWNGNITQTRAAPEVGAEVIQVVYNRLDRKPEEEVLPACRQLRLGVLARVPLASGFLSGKYRPGASFPANDVREVWMKNRRDETLREVERIACEEVPEGVDMAQWALAWCLRNPAVTSVIPGCKSVEQVRSNAAAANLLAGG